MPTLAPLTLLVLAVANADDTGITDVPANPGPIMLVDELDAHPDGDAYCVDIFGATVEVGDGMQAHNCHPDHARPAADQTFTSDYPSPGKIYVTFADLCVEPGRVRAGALLHAAECTSDSSQSWVASSDGQIHPADDTSLCWAVEPGPDGRPGAPGKNTKRGLTLETCADVDPRLTTWFVPGGSIGS